MPAMCHLYLSPNEKYNLSEEHIDAQEAFIFQMVNHKLWKIYQDDRGEDLRSSHKRFTKDICKAYKCLTLSQREILYLPSNVVHKAECKGDTPSVHLKFFLEVVPKGSLYESVFDILKEEMKKTFNFDEPLDSTSLVAMFKHFQSLVASLDMDHWAQGYGRAQFLRSARMLKKGKTFIYKRK